MIRRTTLGCVLLLLAVATGAEARTWNVRKDDTGDYKVIQDAVDHAASGDTILIGPGRYEEKKPYSSYSADKWTFDVYVAVTVSDLTLIGSGSGQTIIGPPTKLWQGAAQPKIICALSGVSRLVVEDIGIEHAYDGIYRSWGGSLTVRRCATNGCVHGINTWADGETLVEDCHFQDIDYGFISWSPAQDVVVRRCTFLACSANFAQTTLNATLSECTFQGYSVGCQYDRGSTGTIANCEFTGMRNYAVVVNSGAVVDLRDNSLLGGAANLWALDAGTVVTGTGNVFGGGSLASIRISNSSVQLHGNHILHGTGPSVTLDTYLAPPTRVLDLSNNYWGTESADTIASWIYDCHDNPAIYGEVNFQPFSGQVIATEQQSWSQVKTLYSGSAKAGGGR